jgi:uncharacterized membrane protein YbhN (UPF0104 family)
VRVVVSLGLLALLAVVLDGRAVLERLRALDPLWVATALATSVVQVVASAWRWRYTAHRLGVRLSLGRAVAEYYRATFLNQVLPGGVVGDVSRALRHRGASADDSRERRSAIHAVLLERVSGQVVMSAVAVGSAALLLAGSGAPPAAWIGAGVVAAMLIAVAAAALRRGSGAGWRAWFAADARAALGGSALPVQLASSLLVVATYLATWLLAALAVGSAVPAGLLLTIAAPVLVAMLLPVSVAGWGLREGAAAALGGVVGVGSGDGSVEVVAISVAYGVLVLAGSLPGAVLIWLSPPGRDRTGDPSRA